MRVKTREEIEEKYKWDLSDIVRDDAEWRTLFAEAQTLKESAAAFEGKLNTRENLLAYFRFEDKISLLISRLYVYARMHQDEKVSDAHYAAMAQNAEDLSVEINTVSSFALPELSALSDEFLNSLMGDGDFADYDCKIKDILREKSIVLSAAEEKIIARVGSFSEVFHDAFNFFDNVDVKFKPFVNSDGEKVRLSHGLYGKIMAQGGREDRRKAMKTMFGGYEDVINTVAAMYTGNVKKDIFYSRTRGFKSALDYSAFCENVPPEVYEKLIAGVHQNIGTLHDYLEYRRGALGVAKLHMYDLHVPIVSEDCADTPYEEAQRIVSEALKPLGEDYARLLSRAYNEKWIDVYENKDKRSGAYSWGCYGAHPYVLMNYTGTLHDVFTLAHELGHAMHSRYSNAAQPAAKADYEIFVAEVASTVNETLLLKSLLKDAEGERRKYLLAYFLDMFRTTVFRQTQFAEFEVEAHAMAERGEALGAEALSQAYFKLNKRYYGGKNVVNDDFIAYEWARIPHFYNSFYVYKYATGLISAVCIAGRILDEGESAVADYKKFLSAGGSMPPVEILKLAGVDLTSDAPYERAMTEFAKTLAQLKAEG